MIDCSCQSVVSTWNVRSVHGESNRAFTLQMLYVGDLGMGNPLLLIMLLLPSSSLIALEPWYTYCFLSSYSLLASLSLTYCGRMLSTTERCPSPNLARDIVFHSCPQLDRPNGLQKTKSVLVPERSPKLQKLQTQRRGIATVVQAVCSRAFFRVSCASALLASFHWTLHRHQAPLEFSRPLFNKTSLTIHAIYYANTLSRNVPRYIRMRPPIVWWL
ncbi:hypothetical protein FB446DRAFT_383408 [Lentinula raphanica]|nr:hypothetical protein FB446DRAFT_383408 [Lentinula raphanica]